MVTALCLKDSHRLARLPEDAHENVNQLLIENHMIPAVDIDAPCPMFFNINVLTFAVVLHKRRIFEVLLELGADVYYRLPTGNTVAQIAKLYDFDLTEFGFAESGCSNISNLSELITSSSSSMMSSLKRSRRSKAKLDKSDSSLKHIKAFVTNLFRYRK
uniref:ANK_REP_REGION domain-containing protein n=1 Tax=Panagrellus redivivus TaxID=6233 RepID=A0A7E4W3U2_PANRE